MKMIMGTLAMVSLLTLASCSTYNTAPASSSTRSAAIGAAAGAIAGKLTGDGKDDRALKGAAIGAIAGYVYSTEADKQRANRGY